ncbi:Mannosyltransferase 1, CMT1 [Ophiocordyceps sinensis CO18]|uniref:Mannosyltransferase 1, CMT1 n=1 Tax=Ophiocordyceps sinensis (strain Co18 / CGMCC 3.14243) TaxID=911162 RepID=T5A9L9_OPHSC|nr:Mannosyltransferase 1, CMT1 [Ophiocordyceps sinensis CO18]
MISPANKRCLRRCLRWRTLRLVVGLFCLVNVLDVLRVHDNLTRGEGGRDASGPSRHERVYIASMHFNNGDVLRHHWNDAVTRLVEVLGPANVFVSIFESGSWDDSKEVLGHLEAALARRGVPHLVETSNTTHRDEMAGERKGEGWIDTPRNRRELRRIPQIELERVAAEEQLFDRPVADEFIVEDAQPPTLPHMAMMGGTAMQRDESGGRPAPVPPPRPLSAASSTGSTGQQ